MVIVLHYEVATWYNKIKQKKQVNRYKKKLIIKLRVKFTLRLCM